MPVTPTTAPATKRKLVELLTSRTALADVAIHYGPVRDAQQLGFDDIAVGRARFSQEWGALGNYRRDERYTVELFLYVKREGDDQQGTEERAWAVLAEVETMLREDPSLGGTVQKAELDGGEQENTADSEGWVTEIVSEIAVQATLPVVP